MNTRFDMSDWLIHFVKAPKDKFESIEPDANKYFSYGEINKDANALDVLRTIIRLGGLLPGKSYRNGKTTLYGFDSVVCASEMPLFAFYEYAKQSVSRGNVSFLGIAIKKEEFFREGGRPAIYGLTQSPHYKCHDDHYRVLNNNILPEEEQYRLVALDMSPGSTNNWMHEREWRWKKNQHYHTLWCKNGCGQKGGVDGLPLLADKGQCFSQFVFIVKDLNQMIALQNDLTAFYLAGSNNYDTPFSKTIIKESKIIVLDENIDPSTNSLKYYSVEETLSKGKVRDSICLHEEPDETERKTLEFKLDRVNDKIKSVKSEYNPSPVFRFASNKILDKTIQHLFYLGYEDIYDDEAFLKKFQTRDYDAAMIYLNEINNEFGGLFNIKEIED